MDEVGDCGEPGMAWDGTTTGTGPTWRANPPSTFSRILEAARRSFGNPERGSPDLPDRRLCAKSAWSILLVPGILEEAVPLENCPDPFPLPSGTRLLSLDVNPSIDPDIKGNGSSGFRIGGSSRS